MGKAIRQSTAPGFTLSNPSYVRTESQKESYAASNASRLPRYGGDYQSLFVHKSTTMVSGKLNPG